jgi:hypothetical protein
MDSFSEQNSQEIGLPRCLFSKLSLVISLLLASNQRKICTLGGTTRDLVETLEEYNDNCHILAVYMYLFVTYTRRILRALQQEFVKEIHYINVKI